MLPVLIVGVVVLTPLADRLRVPQPVLLLLYGLGVGLLPGTREIAVDPELVLPVVLPPLLFAATQRTTVREFRDQAGAVLVLAVGLTLATVGVVAVSAHALGVPWVAAWVLGAVVSPPDPVAATAVARRLHLPHRLVTILEGEGMFNDATALVAYKVAVAAAVTGSFSALEIGGTFALTVVVGLAVGLVMGLAVTFSLGRTHDGYVETTITLAAPFVAYVGAEHLEGSGVLAVLVLGLWLRSYSHAATSARGWLLGRFVWSYADFLITSLVFALLGYELISVLERTEVTGELVRLSLVTVGAVVVFRALWIFPTTLLARARARRKDLPLPTDLREAAVVSWAGMRGVVTVATALALPEVVDGGAEFPMRDSLIVAAFTCVLLTLVVQGLSLAPLTRRLGVSSEDDPVAEMAGLRRESTQAALDYVEGADDVHDLHDEVRESARVQYAAMLRAQDAMAEARRLDRYENDDRTPADELEDLLANATDIERGIVLEARRTGRVSAGSADEVLRQIESRALRDLA